MENFLRKINDRISYKVILCIGICALIIISLFTTANLSMLYLKHDEFGYWANAALIAGKDWSGVTSISPFYSYGYSIVLAPLLLLFTNTTIIYKLALWLNVLFYLFAYLISFKCMSELLEKYNKRLIAIGCTVVMLYGSYLFNICIPWVEPFIYLMYWLTIYVLIEIYKKCSIINIALFSFLLVYMYTIHQRALGVLVAGIVVILLLFYKKKISIIQLIEFLASILIFMLISAGLKGIFVTELWSNSITNSSGRINDYSGQLGKVILCLTNVKYFLKLVRGCLSKLLYLTISTGGIILFGGMHCTKTICNRKVSFNVEKAISIFCLLSLLSEIVISSLFFVESQRLDTILYGRYSEFVIAPIFVLGLFEIINGKFSLKRLGIILLFIVVNSGLIYNYMTKQGFFLNICTVNASLFFNHDANAFNFIKYIVFGIIFCTLVTYLLSKNKLYYKIISVALLLLFWITSCFHVVRTDIKKTQNNYLPLEELSSYICNQSEEIPIYFYYDINNDGYENRSAENLQYLMFDEKIEVITEIDYEQLKTPCYLFVPSTCNLNVDGTLIKEENVMKLYKIR